MNSNSHFIFHFLMCVLFPSYFIFSSLVVSPPFFSFLSLGNDKESEPLAAMFGCKIFSLFLFFFQRSSFIQSAAANRVM